MLRSQLLEQATMDDIYEAMAFDMIKNKEQRQGLILAINQQAQKERTPEEQEAWILAQLSE
ncbi:hypothetical protein [Neptuniibacter pectenicola]|uniref:hypothetical protein n=1 Tax=Neptuniibacter pectenicola TaxID=1806669 RepID=UPI000795122F|nr:hypothetical protein [Neptuniibacter pectenicola]KXJ57191.1 MAG: hypothetical protein AXW15_13730 [Neptuniibacter sp. Phe_28]